MEKQIKVIIFSHESDIDGLGSIVLGKIAFGNIDYVLVSNVQDLEFRFRELMESGRLNIYDKIYITDLALYNPSLKIVSNDPVLSQKVLVFDHHKSAINEGYNNYDFTTIMEVDQNGKKRCGTELFYEYLCSMGYISKTSALDEFVELTRLEDAWEWKNALNRGQKAHDMAILFNAVGIEQYIERMYTKLLISKMEFDLTSEEKELISNKKNEYLENLQRIWSNAEFLKDELENNYAAVFADYEFRNELSEYVSGLNIINLQYLVIVALEKGLFGQKSYRAITKNFDVGKIAEAHGGYGHPGAASVNITEEQKKHALVLRKRNTRESLEYLVNSSYK